MKSVSFCEVVNNIDPLKCDSCTTGFSLNYNKTVCLDCKSLDPGCNTCAANIENNLMPENCINCVGGLVLDPITGKCGLAHCEAWTRKTINTV